MCYHMYIHIEITYVRELMTLTLGIDWADGVCLDSYIHSSTGGREPHDVL